MSMGNGPQSQTTQRHGFLAILLTLLAAGLLSITINFSIPFDAVVYGLCQKVQLCAAVDPPKVEPGNLVKVQGNCNIVLDVDQGSSSTNEQVIKQRNCGPW